MSETPSTNQENETTIPFTPKVGDIVYRGVQFRKLGILEGIDGDYGIVRWEDGGTESVWFRTLGNFESLVVAREENAKLLRKLLKLCRQKLTTKEGKQ